MAMELVCNLSSSRRRTIGSSGLCQCWFCLFKLKDTNESLALCLSRQALGWKTPWERCPFMWRSSLIPTLGSTRSQ